MGSNPISRIVTIPKRSLKRLIDYSSFSLAE